MSKSIEKIWIVDDERIVRVALADDLRDAGYKCMEFSDAASLLSMLQDETPDVIISDYKMPQINGYELLLKVKEINPMVVFILMTAYGTIKDAVKAIQSGAYHYVLKPFDTKEVLLVLNRINEIKEIQKENVQLRKEITQKFNFKSYVGDNKLNSNLFELLKKVATKDSTVLITGETGTGKELVAGILHYNSLRKREAFVKVSCAILSKEIFESELFGHVKGAYTGADCDKKGRFELANSGTLYIDDVDDVPLELQVKLLRAIEQREIEKVGSSQTISVDVRLIASTKTDLKKLVEQGKFREDLYYRLNVFPVEIPPLRQRKEDIELLIEYYLKEFTGRQDIRISGGAMRILSDYNWPGNVRELKNIAERISILTDENMILSGHIPHEIKNADFQDVCAKVGQKPLDRLMADIEIQTIKCALERTENNRSKAAALLGIPVSTLQSKMIKYNL